MHRRSSARPACACGLAENDKRAIARLASVQVGYCSHSLTEVSNRTQDNVLDVRQALMQCGTSISDIQVRCWRTSPSHFAALHRACFLSGPAVILPIAVILPMIAHFFGTACSHSPPIHGTDSDS